MNATRMCRPSPTTLLTTLATCAALIGCIESSDEDVDTSGAALTSGSCADAQIAKVSASGNDGNVPANVLDGNLSTRWSGEGKGSFITADLGGVKSVCSASVAWYLGSARRSRFRVQLSSDGTTFTQVFSGQSSGTTTALETYAFTPANARYVRVVVYGNTQNDWASITELRVSAAGGSTGSSPPPPPSSSPPPPPPPPPPPASSGTCDLSATPSNFAAQVAAASAGQRVCLATGDYGTWKGTNKAITVAAASGASPSMTVDFGSGAYGFTLDGIGGMAGTVNGAHDFTIKNSTFTDSIDITATNANILFDHNKHDWNAVYTGFMNAKVRVANDTGAFSGVTIQSSTFTNGDLDGVHLGAGINVLNSVFSNLCDVGTNHTDNIQYEGGTGGRIAGNYVYASSSCDTQGITSFDGGTVGVTIEDNVIDIRRPWGIELYSDTNSIIRHNTLRWYADADCDFGGLECGQISLDRKSADPAGSGTQVYDNLTTDVSIADGSTGTTHDNVSAKTAVFVGPLTQYAGFKLASSSPVGLNTASDGSNNGARIP